MTEIDKSRTNCLRKRRFYDISLANEQAIRRGLQVYQCPECSYYHLTSKYKPKSKKNKICNNCGIEFKIWNREPGRALKNTCMNCCHAKTVKKYRSLKSFPVN
jgi:hypothetical protein